MARIGRTRDEARHAAAQPRRRFGAVRWLAPVAAMVAVIGIITGVSGCGQSTLALPAGTPKYYVTLQGVIPGRVTATVRNSATGAALASVPIVRIRPGEKVLGQRMWIAAATNDRVFAIGDPLGAIDILRLARGGGIAALTHLPKKISSYESAVLSPAGTQLAVPIPPPVIPSCTKSSSCTSGVEVVSLATGATRTWLARAPFEEPTFVVNWPGTGHIVFIYYGDGYRLLNVAGPGGSLLANSRPIASPVVPHGWVIQDPLLTPDGKAVIWGSTRTSRGGKDRAVAGGLLEFSADTGRLLRVLYRPTGHIASSNFPECTLESAGPTGLHVLMRCFSFGRLDGSRFTALSYHYVLNAPGSQAAW